MGHLPIYVQSTTTTNSNSSTEISPSSSKSENKLTKYGTVSHSQTVFNVTLVDCSAHKSCVSCTQSSRNACRWSRADDVCRHNEEANEEGELVGSVGASRECESFDTGTNKLLIPYTAHRLQA